MCRELRLISKLSCSDDVYLVLIKIRKKILLIRHNFANYRLRQWVGDVNVLSLPSYFLAKLSQTSTYSSQSLGEPESTEAVENFDLQLVICYE